jgi:hypothetical protein
MPSPFDYLTRPQIMAESGGDPNAVSPKGATGIMQVMPATARDPGFGLPNIFDLARQMGKRVPGNDPVTLQNLLRDPEVNQAFGVAYRDAMIQRQGGNVAEGLAAYNAGPGAVDRAGGVPNFPETQNYVARLMGDAQQPQPQPQGQPSQPPAMMQAQAAPMPGMAQGGPDQAAPSSDPSFFQSDKFGNILDSLAIGVNSLRMNPDANIAQAAQGRMAERKGKAATNKTVEFLRAQGRTDLADAVESGSLDAKGAMGIVYQAPKDERTSIQKNFEFFKSLGMSEADAIASSKSGTTVNVGDNGPKLVGQDQMLVPDPNSPAGFRMVSVPGGRADVASQTAQTEAAAAQAENDAVTQAAQRGKEVKASVISQNVDALLKTLDRGGVFNLPEAGLLGNALGALGLNQDAVDFKNTLATLQSGVALGTLQAMKEASKTGGALGAVSEKELDLLINALGALKQDSSPALLRTNLKVVKEVMGKIDGDPTASQFLNSGGPSAAPTPPGDSGGFPLRRVIQ